MSYYNLSHYSVKIEKLFNDISFYHLYYYCII